MSLLTHSKFYYGYEVTPAALYLDFDEGGGELTATLEIGSYTLTEFVAEVARALNEAGANTYTVTVDRATRIITIAADSSTDLLVEAGSHLGTTAWGLLGFTTNASIITGGGGGGGGFNFENVVNASTTADTVTNTTAPGDVWNAGATSVESAAGDGYVEFKTNAIDGGTMTGFTEGFTGTFYTQIDYAIYLPGPGENVQIFESGAQVASGLGTYTNSDVMRVERIGTTIYYKNSGNTIYTSGNPSADPLYFQTSINGPSGAPGDFGGIVDIVTDFVSTATDAIADVAAGSEYVTQFILQSHVKSEHSQGATYATLNKSASGKVEVVKFGDEYFMEANIKYATDYLYGASTPIRNNATGVADLNAFLIYLISKGPIEFMADEDAPETFEKMILESTPDDSKGLKYKLKELYGQGLPGYFETGVLKFRVAE